VSTIRNHTPARLAPLAFITTLLLATLYLICGYYKVPLWLTVIFEIVLFILCVRGMQQAFRPDGWMNKED
jgi:hypothetical protein